MSLIYLSVILKEITGEIAGNDRPKIRIDLNELVQRTGSTCQVQVKIGRCVLLDNLCFYRDGKLEKAITVIEVSPSEI